MTYKKTRYLCLHCFEEIEQCNDGKFFCGGIGEYGEHTGVVERDLYNSFRDKFIIK